MTATDKTLEKNIWSGMVVTSELCKCSEELRDLSALSLLPSNDQDPGGASPTTEVQVAGRVMADMFDDGSIFLASFVLLNMVQTLASQNTS